MKSSLPGMLFLEVVYSKKGILRKKSKANQSALKEIDDVYSQFLSNRSILDGHLKKGLSQIEPGNGKWVRGYFPPNKSIDDIFNDFKNSGLLKCEKNFRKKIIIIRLKGDGPMMVTFKN